MQLPGAVLHAEWRAFAAAHLFPLKPGLEAWRKSLSLRQLRHVYDHMETRLKQSRESISNLSKPLMLTPNLTLSY